jgi:hypothetical protein
MIIVKVDLTKDNFLEWLLCYDDLNERIPYIPHPYRHELAIYVVWNYILTIEFPEHKEGKMLVLNWMFSFRDRLIKEVTKIQNKVTRLEVLEMIDDE